MRKQLKENLEGYNDIAKDKTEKISGMADDDLDILLGEQFDSAAKQRGTSRRTQEKLYGIQLEKQKVMQWLKEEIKKLDLTNSKEIVPENSVRVHMNEGVYIRNINGEEKEMTLGMIMTDGEWGIDYSLDPDTIPRNIRKRYLIEKAKMLIRGMLDDQIIEEESNSTLTHGLKQMAYDEVWARKEKKGEMAGGIIAETMVRNFLKKISYDFDMDFTLFEADVYQDVEQKIDFIVHRKSNAEGVKVKEEEMDENIGIQFTTNPNATEKKRMQVDRSKKMLRPEDHIDNILLITVPLERSAELYRQWEKDGRPSGGPDEYLGGDIKKIIFKAILNSIYDEVEIEKQWSKIKTPLVAPNEVVTIKPEYLVFEDNKFYGASGRVIIIEDLKREARLGKKFKFSPETPSEIIDLINS